MAIDDLLDEHEQSERVLKWLRANAFGLIGGVALGLGAIYGWLWWQDKNEAGRLKASDDYRAFITDVQAGKLKEAQTKATALKDTGFAVLAAMDLAKAQVDGGKRDEAIATLRGVLDADSPLAPIVRQRLARLLIDAGKAEEAIKTLADADDAGSLEIVGDAHFALGRRDQARSAYDKALGKLEDGAALRNALELKLVQVGGKPPAADSAATGKSGTATPAS